MKVYKIKKLIEGVKIHPRFTGITFVAIPDSYLKLKEFRVEFGNKYMVIDTETYKPLERREFRDKFQRNKTYTLYYFKWVENSVQKLEQVPRLI